MKFIPIVFSLSAIVSITVADWQFRSRPDLSAPILNITIPATEETSPGYIFAAPFSGFADKSHHGPRQEGPYIFTDKGELVWSGFGYYSIWATNFQKARYKGEDILFSFEGSHNPYYGHGHGHITLLNKNYETIKELRAGKHKVSDKLEFHIINEKTALIQIYQPVPAYLTPYNATPEQQWIVDSIFQELDIETGEVFDAWDYFHINSVDKDEDGNYLLSARNAASLYKIDGSSGEIIWKLGGLPNITSSSFDTNFNFSFQHHARWIEQDGSKEIISFYDISAQGTENEVGNVVSYSPTSSGKVIEVDFRKGNAKLLKYYLPPDNLLSKSQGSNQILPNGNAIVNWGSSGAVTEFNKEETPIFHAYFESGHLGEKVENYRAFKFNWTGVPHEDIAVFSEYTNDDETKIYVSWNGDTRTKTWKFFTVEEDGSRILLGSTHRTGFGTIFTAKKKIDDGILVEAFSADGTKLGSSESVYSRKPVLPYNKSIVSLNSSENTSRAAFLNYFEWKVLAEFLGGSLS
ncbi:Arylsulfotrans [Kluyveromyces marxianus]